MKGRYRIKVCEKMETCADGVMQVPVITFIPQVKASGLWWDLHFCDQVLNEKDARALIESHKAKTIKNSKILRYVTVD